MRRYRRPDTRSRIAKMRRLIKGELIYAIAADGEVPRMTGRPWDYPQFMYVLYGAMNGKPYSATLTEAEFATPEIWKILQDAVRERFPSDTSMWLRDEPMRRHHWQYWKRVHTGYGILEEINRSFTENSAELAIRVGLMDPDGPGSLTHPTRERALYGDVKDIPALYSNRPGATRTDKETGEIKECRFDKEAWPRKSKITTKDARDTHYYQGHSVSICAARNDDVRVILGVRSVIPRDEAEDDLNPEEAAYFSILEDLKDLLPGAEVSIYDMGLRGRALDRLMSRFGYLPISRVPKRPGKLRADGTRGEKEVPDEVVEVISVRVGPGDVREVTIRAVDGQVGAMVPDVEGRSHFVALELMRVIRTQNKSGGYRMYAQYRLPEDLGGGPYLVRLNAGDDETLLKQNRADWLRPHPPASAEFQYLHARRSDIESFNRTLDDSLWLQRSRSLGRRATLLDVICTAIYENAAAEEYARERERNSVAA